MDKRAKISDRSGIAGNNSEDYIGKIFTVYYGSVLVGIFLIIKYHQSNSVFEYEKIFCRKNLENAWRPYSCDVITHKYWNGVTWTKDQQFISEEELEDLILRTI